MYKLAFSVVVDKTTAIYLLLIGGYLFASFFILGDFVNEHYDFFMMIEEQAEKRLWLIVTILPIRYVTQSFRMPGIVFSSSEYKLSLLPYEREKIWLACVFAKWRKTFVFSLLVALIVILMTPISMVLVIKYIALFVLIDLLMTIPQWKLYQAKIWEKTGWLLLMFIINTLGFFTNSVVIGLVFIGSLTIFNYLMKRDLFKDVNWSKVTEISDFQQWNLPILSKISEVEIKREKRYSIFQNLKSRKKPFEYTEDAIHHRLWFTYLGHNIQPIFQIMGALFLMLFVFLFINEYLFQIGLVVSIHIYTTALAVFFEGQFQSTMLQALPWNLPRYKETYSKWALFGSMILLIPISVFIGTHATLWTPLQLLFYGSTFFFIYHVKIDKTVALLAKQHASFDLDESIGWALLIGIIFNLKYPFLSLGFIIPIARLLKKKSILTHHS